MSWSLNYLKSKQIVEHNSFIGGKPKIPLEKMIPNCSLCGSSQTFMFQVAFPDKSCWEGKSLAMFFCTSCADEDYFIPEMLNSKLKNVDIPLNFLTKYQKNFSFITFSTEQGILKQDYEEKVKFHMLEIEPSTTIGNFGKIEGEPDWILEDESPKSYNSIYEMYFLFEIIPNFQFPICQSAPKQIELNLSGEPEQSRLDYYELFLGNGIYFFGTKTEEPLIYTLTQVD